MTTDGGGVRVRAAGPDDAPLLLTTNHELYAEALRTARGLAPEEAERKARDDVARLLPQGLDTPGHVVLVADVDGRPAGVVWLALAGPDGPGRAVLHHLWVDLRARRRGVGHALVEAATDEARRAGARHLDLDVFATSADAVRLYEAMGFTVTAQHMRLALDD